MSKRTQKAGIAARFGPRYGVSVRRNAAAALRRSKASYRCPRCQYQKVRRQSIGIWVCSKCGHTFAGGAWEPYTRASVANQRILRRSAEGATTTDMAHLAQQAAIAYQQQLAEAAEDEDEAPVNELEPAPVDTDDGDEA